MGYDSESHDSSELPGLKKKTRARTPFVLFLTLKYLHPEKTGGRGKNSVKFSLLNLPDINH